MPTPRQGESRGDFVSRCIPVVLEDGTAQDQDQAVAVCNSMWEDGMEKSVSKATWTTAYVNDLPDSSFALVESGDKDGEGKTTPRSLRHLPYKDAEGKVDLPHLRNAIARANQIKLKDGSTISESRATSIQNRLRRILENMGGKSALLLDMAMTKAERLDDGRIRWRARANSGEFDLEDDRFDPSFWGDVIHNFGRQAEARGKGETPPDNMPIPILDLAHYSFRLPSESRSKAQAGWIERLWQDGSALMALGYFCDTPLGRAAANAAMTRPATERRVSVGVWPDWGRVELRDGKRIYKGGRNRAYLDHLAMTAHPIDPNTLLEVKAMNQKDDALDVLGDSDEAKTLVDELEEAKGKSLPDGAVVKAEEEDSDAEEPQAEEVEEPEVEEEPEQAPEAELLSAAEMTAVLKTFTESLSDAIDRRLISIDEAVGELKSQVEALAASETQKVQAAIESDGGWLWELMRENSVRGKSTVKGGGTEEPEEARDESDPFYRMFGGLKKE